MKIYFIDDAINDKDMDNANHSGISFSAILRECAGYSDTMRALNELNTHLDTDSKLLTNCIIALKNKYCWNEDLQVPELYIWQSDKKEFIRVDKLTDKQLRRAHDLEKLYRNGVF